MKHLFELVFCFLIYFLALAIFGEAYNTWLALYGVVAGWLYKAFSDYLKEKQNESRD